MEHRYYVVYCREPNNVHPEGFAGELGECPPLTEGNIILKLSLGPYRKYRDSDILVDHPLRRWVYAADEEVPPWILNCTQWRIDSIIPTIVRDRTYSHTVLLVSPAKILG